MFNTKPNINTQVKLLMTDTDSLCYEIRRPASFVYRKLEKCSWMDFSNYNKSNHYQSFYSMSKYLTPGYFKDELSGNFLLEFCGANCKVYSFLAENDVEKIRLKGVKLSFTSQYIRHIDFLKAVTESTENFEVEYACFSQIISQNQQLKTVLKSKKSVHPFNDKKFFLSNRIAYSFGHYKIQ